MILKIIVFTFLISFSAFCGESAFSFNTCLTQMAHFLYRPPLVEKIIFPENSLPKNRVLILSSKNGFGHDGASRGIEELISIDDQDAVVKSIHGEDLRTGMRNLDRQIELLGVKVSPKIFNFGFNTDMNNGIKAKDITKIMGYLNEDDLLTFIEDNNPGTIFVTHPLIARDLASLRAKGYLKNRKIAFVFTDYYTGFFYRIPEYLDATFLPHEAVKAAWEEAGANKNKMFTTGMPCLNAKCNYLPAKDVQHEFRIDTNRPKILVFSGGEAIGNFSEIVEKLLKNLNGSGAQIIAVAGKNESQYQKVLLLAEKAKAENSDVKIIPLKKLKAAKYLGLLAQSDLFVGKAGGLAPSEAIEFQVPMLLVNLYQGHETFNIRFYEAQGVARVSDDLNMLGKDALSLIENKDELSAMKERQKKYVSEKNFNPILQFYNESKMTP
jgi:processive 1,2-diacylglycerol beta-glucosyltransferase